MFDFLRNTLMNRGRYKTHSEAVIVACFFNPQNSPYRLLAFQKWYRTIRHLPHRIVECLIGEESESQLPESEYITQVRADSLMFHKEALLNHVVKELPSKFRYVFWLDTDVLFTDNNWLVNSVAKLKNEASVVQPFEWCVHLEKNTDKPDFDVEAYKPLANDVNRRHKRLWRSFAANHVTTKLSGDNNYDIHGHVGFAWGARREVLEQCPLFDKAVIGGADHVIAHATVGQIPHPCITKGFADNIEETLAWSKEWRQTVLRNTGTVESELAFVPGDLYHIWHGDISNRKYLKRIQEFTGATKKMDRDKAGFYKVTGPKAAYMRRYYEQREVHEVYDFEGFDADFFMDMGYALADIIELFGQPYQDVPDYDNAAQQGVDSGWPVQPVVPDSTPGVGWPSQPVVPDSNPWPAQPAIPDSTPDPVSLENASPFVPKVDDVLPSTWEPGAVDKVDVPMNDAGWEPATVPDTPDNSGNFS